MRTWLLIACALFSGICDAHKPSDSYLSLEARDQALHGQWDIALRDLEFAIGLDADGNGAITWGELRAKHSEVAAYAFARLAVRGCTIKPGAHLVDQHTDGAYAVLQFTLVCGRTLPQQLELEYSLFADLDPSHRGLLRARLGSQTVTAVLGPDQPRLELDPEGRSRWQQFLEYSREGVWHIWIGFDHVLFLVSLLLPAVLSAPRFAPAFWDVFKVVSAFTVAHSITLALAALAVVALPSRVVESAIAASVVLAAPFLPIAYALRHTWMYRRMIFVGGSAVIALIAALWMVERVFDLQLGLI